MKLKDYQDYQKNNVKAAKSQLKEYIQIYADMAKKLKSESAEELDPIKANIKKTYPTEYGKIGWQSCQANNYRVQ